MVEPGEDANDKILNQALRSSNTSTSNTEGDNEWVNLDKNIQPVPQHSKPTSSTVPKSSPAGVSIFYLFYTKSK